MTRQGPVAPTETTRDRILDAAETLLGRLGYGKTTVDDIARSAGLSKRTIYLHFPGKEEVMLSTIDRIVERLLTRLERAADLDAPPADRLRAMLRLRVLFRFDSVRDYHAGLDELLRAIRPAYMARRARYFEREAAVLARVLDAGQADRSLAVDDPLDAAHALILATNALLPSSLSTRELGSRAEVEARTLRIADLLLDGLRRRPP